MSFLGFGFSGYRSVGDELVLIAPLNKINLIIGQNNSGKSNIINFLKYGLANAVNNSRGSYFSGNDYAFLNTDNHVSTEPIKHKIAFPFLVPEMVNDSFNGNYDEKRVYELKQKLFKSDGFIKRDEYTLVTYEAASLNSPYHVSCDTDKISSIMEPNEWQFLVGHLTNRNYSDLINRIVETISAISSVHIPNEIPPIEIIPAIRKIGEAGTEGDDFSGLGIIEKLAKLQNPALEP